MNKEEKDTKKKVVEGKKNARKATKDNTKKKLAKAADQALLEMAAAQPAGKGKFLLDATIRLDKVDAELAKWNLVKRGIRGELKENKIDLAPYDQVRKLRKKDPEDQRAYKASEALYTEQLGMELSPDQKVQIEEINKQREAARKGMSEITGGDAGKEIGAGTAADVDDVLDSDNIEDVQKVGIPAKNETLGLKVISPHTH